MINYDSKVFTFNTASINTQLQGKGFKVQALTGASEISLRLQSGSVVPLGPGQSFKADESITVNAITSTIGAVLTLAFGDALPLSDFDLTTLPNPMPIEIVTPLPVPIDGDNPNAVKVSGDDDSNTVRTLPVQRDATNNLRMVPAGGRTQSAYVGLSFGNNGIGQAGAYGAPLLVTGGQWGGLTVATLSAGAIAWNFTNFASVRVSNFVAGSGNLIVKDNLGVVLPVFIPGTGWNYTGTVPNTVTEFYVDVRLAYGVLNFTTAGTAWTGGTISASTWALQWF